METSSFQASASSRVLEAVGDLHSTHDRLREIRRLLGLMGYRPGRASPGGDVTGIATGRTNKAAVLEARGSKALAPDLAPIAA
jgi:hypothetical protein